MKYQYFGDVGDYGKYGLLRFIAKRGITIAVNWYLTPDDQSNDGNIRGYLANEKNRIFDPELFDVLREMNINKEKRVSRFAKREMIPGAVYFDNFVQPMSDDLSLSAAEKRLARERWHQQGLAGCLGKELVFMDPDNGLRAGSPTARKDAPKFVYASEIYSYYNRGQNVVYYCHKGRRTEAQGERAKRIMQDYCPDAAKKQYRIQKGKIMENVLEQWNVAAEKYTEDQEASIYSESNKETVKNRFQNLTGLKVLDLGCGYGFYTDYFQSIGADVIGVDGSEKMLKIAEKRYPRCTFELCDISKKFPFENKSFDLVFCNQVLMDIEDIETVFSECYRVLKQNGIFYYSIVHPAFYDSVWLENENGFKYAKAISSYIEPYSFLNTFWGETKHFHRSLSYYLNTAAKHGFYLRHIDEPVSYDGITKNKDLPLFFFAEYLKK